tara:strand:+ start:54 stop:374 length:321 start_codon:yes stop_codon:yes gene_type:complete
MSWKDIIKKERAGYFNGEYISGSTSVTVTDTNTDETVEFINLNGWGKWEYNRGWIGPDEYDLRPEEGDDNHININSKLGKWGYNKNKSLAALKLASNQPGWELEFE